MLYVKKSKRALRLFTALLLPLLFSATHAQAQTRIGSISFDTDVYDVAVNPSNNRIYVPSGYFFSGQIVVVDGDPGSPTFNQAVAHVSMPSNSYPHRVAVNPNTGRVYVTDYFANRLLVIDGANNTYLTSIPLGAQPVKLAVNPSTNRIYVSVEAGVVVVDGSSNEVINNISFAGEFPYAVAVNSATNRIYVTSISSNTVSVIDGMSDAVEATIPVYSPYSIAVNPSTNIIYVTNTVDGTITVIQGSSSTVEAVLPVGYYANSVAVNVASQRIYVTDALGGTISIIDGDKFNATYHQKLASLLFPTPRMYDMAVNPGTNLFYVTTSLLFVFHDPPPTASALLATLIEKVKSYNLAQGVTNSLIVKLESAQSALNSSNGNNGSLSCIHMRAFINEMGAHAGREELTSAQANDLKGAAEKIRRALGCQ